MEGTNLEVVMECGMVMEMVYQGCYDNGNESRFTLVPSRTIGFDTN